jgi:hypothetical protein
MLRTVVSAFVLLLTAGCADAFAWGCAGHQAVAIIATRLLKPSSLAALKAVLAASPIDPALKRGCSPVSADPVVDASTWADDERAIDAATSPWHFINMPRSLASRSADPRPYCTNGRCIVDAIPAQFQALQTTSSSVLKASAVRFLIHFVGDIHQPLHVITNGDRGGNCFPVTYLGRAPEQDDRGAFAPELHGVWDTSVVGSIMKAHGLNGAGALADYVVSQSALPSGVAPSVPTSTRVTSWARDSHALARSVVYGRLPRPVPMEPATALTLSSCSDNHDVVHRMLALHEQLQDPYEQAAEAVVLAQLRIAGIRLAAVLAAAFPG